MKLMRATIKVFIAILVIILVFGTVVSTAFQDYSSSNALSLILSYFRYVNGEYTNGYAYNTVGNEGESNFPIFQIISTDNKTNYFCLNAKQGESWLTGTSNVATFNRSYDLNSESDLQLLKNETNSVYSNVANSEYLTQILWILDNTSHVKNNC